jgi:hypothetical protein
LLQENIVMTRTAAYVALGLCLSAVPCAAAPADRGVLDDYFSIWSDNARITPSKVASLYGRTVVYYGRTLSQAGVYRDKLGVVRRWPHRRYEVVPGSVAKSCDAVKDHCRVSLILAWEVAATGQRRPSHGRSSVVLTLSRQDGTLKIVRESGARVRSAP